jgi:hypothetical protein
LLKLAIETVAALIRSGMGVLVYCGAGMSRSPCVAGAALAMVRGCPVTEGLSLALGSGAADVSPALWNELLAVVSSKANPDSV